MVEEIKENEVLNDLVSLIEVHRQNAYRKINEELVSMYYGVGKHLSKKVKREKWWYKIIEKIANEIVNFFS